MKKTLVFTLMLICAKGWATYDCAPDDVVRIRTRYCPASCTPGTLEDPRAYLDCIKNCIDVRCSFECNDPSACNGPVIKPPKPTALESSMVPGPKLPPPK